MNSEVSSVLGSVGVCQIVCDVLQAANAMGEARSLVQATCWAVRNLACSSKLNHSLFAITEICSVLQTTLSKFKDDAFIVESALLAFANLCCSPEIAKNAATIATAPEVLGLVRNHSTDPSVVEASMWFCRNFAAAGIENQTQLFQSSIGEDIVAVLSSFPHHEDILAVTLGALANLVAGSDEIRNYFVHKLQISTIVVRNFAENARFPSVAAMSCKAILGLCLNADGLSIVNSLGAPKIAASTLRLHIVQEEVVIMCCELLWQLVYRYDEEIKALLLEKGAVDAEGIVKISNLEEVSNLWLPEPVLTKYGW